ncbi:MAG: asparagine synthase (glutamine-hydrolyzing) [Candidatus Magasanikbacteria bacterium]|nr:asparagine synthase (glutamine-hydrolyzing) [Candidatus Magasanikbacteria bacterium]
MCGINGFNFKNAELIQKMNERTHHRGPDRTDLFVGETISLGHNRLSIIDLSERGKQPMWDAARELVIVFNGEIYNFQELRQELEKKYLFRSQSDTEVILYAYREWGIECVKKFNGIFAFALWDMRTNELYLARDQSGVKPLYYFYDGTRLIFSSEIKSLLVHDIPREVDPEAFNLYFQLLYIPEPYTMFRGIKKLPAASYLKLHGATVVIKKYWQVDRFEDLGLYEDAKKEIRRLFDDSVKRQLISDRPVGVFLSGGLDSTAVLGRVKQCSAGSVKTFSVGFSVQNSQEKFNADFFLARQTAKFYGTDHYELTISAKDIENNLATIAWHLDEPNFNPTAGAIFLLSKMAKEQVAVVLGGDGADELFGGYPRYFYSNLISRYQRLPRTVRSLGGAVLRIAGKDMVVRQLALPPNEQRALAFLAQKEALLSRVINPGVYRPKVSEYYLHQRYFSGGNLGDFEKQFMQLDRQSWLVDESLLRSDKMTMAHGLEERVPILDYRLVELAARIPTHWKMKTNLSNWHRFQGKYIWREAIREYLPDHLLREEKRGWFTPMAKWLRAELRSPVEKILSRLEPAYFNQEAVREVWQKHLTGEVYNLNIIWAMVMWQLWYEQFIKDTI